MRTAEPTRLVRFALGGEEYALDLDAVVEVARPPAARALGDPAGPAREAGQVSGVWLPLVELRARLGLPSDGRARRVMVVHNPEGGRVGLLVDAVTEVVPAAPGDLLPPPPVFGGTGNPVTALVRLPEEDRFAMLVALESLFTPEELRALARFDGSQLEEPQEEG